MGITFSMPMELPCFLKIAPPVAVANHLASCGTVQGSGLSLVTSL